MKSFNKIVFVMLLLLFVIILASCNDSEFKHYQKQEISKVFDLGEASKKNYYVIEDFESITIGESTYKDVYNIASQESMQVTSYGGVCEFPIKNGGYIVVKFYGEDLVVGVIEELPASKRFDK